MTVVMTPTGSPEVPMTLEIISEHTRSSAPSTADAGMTYFRLDPKNILATCGIINPTKPIVPVEQTTVAVHMDTTTSMNCLHLFGLTPRAVAMLSPAPMTFIVPFMYMKTPIATKAAVMTKGIESHDTSASVPTPHEYNFAMSEELAVYFISVVAAVNTYMTPIPMRIMVVGVVFLRNVNRMMTAVGINAKMNALMI